MSTNTKEPGEVVSGYYDNYKETQREILVIETRKTRNTLLTAAVVILVLNILGLLMAGLNTRMLLAMFTDIAFIPALLAALAFLAMKEPLVAVIIAAAVVVGIWVYEFLVLGKYAVLIGWLSKAILIYLLIAGFQHAREATKIRRELRTA